MNSPEPIVLRISREGAGDVNDVVPAGRIDEIDTGVEPHVQPEEQLTGYLRQSSRRHQEKLK